MRIAPVQALIFDMDGTMIDSMPRRLDTIVFAGSRSNVSSTLRIQYAGCL